MTRRLAKSKAAAWLALAGSLAATVGALVAEPACAAHLHAVSPELLASIGGVCAVVAAITRPVHGKGDQ